MPTYFLKISILTIITTIFISNYFTYANPSIIIDSINKKILINSGGQNLDLTTIKNQLSGNSVTPPTQNSPTPQASQNTTNEKNPTGTLPSTLNEELTHWTELEKALYRMYRNGLTKYNTLSDYRPEDPLLREEASKIITQAYLVLGYPTSIKNNTCTFSDQAQFDPSLSSHIQQSCQYGIFKGSNGNFLPRKNLTKAEALTVLIRIFEGSSSNENLTPRRTLYFIKAKSLFLTNETNVNTLEKSITRGEIALLIYRFKSILLNNQLKTIAQTQLSNINQNPSSFLATYLNNTTNSGNNTSTPINNQLTHLLSGAQSQTSSLSILNNPEITEAMHRMREYGMTNATDISTYQPFDPLTREQAAKMFVQFAKVQNLSSLSDSQTICNFKDLKNADPNLQNSIQSVCNLWLMQGANWLFLPKELLSKSQFIALLIRLAQWGHLNEQTNPRRSNYFIKARELWIINNDDALSFENPLTRYEAALLFYRFHIKQKITTTLNTTQLKNELITTIKNADGSYLMGTGGHHTLSIDTNLLKNQFFQWGFVELLGARYSLKKTNMTTFDIGEESFVRYGDLFDLSNDTKIWNLNLIVSNGNIIDGTIRLTYQAKTRKIKIDPTTTARYQLING